VKYNGSMSSLFDLVEDLDSSACIAKLVDIYAPAPAPQENEVDDFEVRAAYPLLCCICCGIRCCCICTCCGAKDITPPPYLTRSRVPLPACRVT
jgi:hypothetical protein